MARGEPPRRSGLPAPYRSPWRALAEALQALGPALRAVIADLVLSARRLARRNLQGELPSPGFWPVGLAPLFWPLIVALLLGLGAVLAFVLLRSAPSASPLSSPSPAAVAPSASGLAPEADGLYGTVPAEAPLPTLAGSPGPLPQPAAAPSEEPAGPSSASGVDGASATIGPFPAAELRDEPVAALQLDPLLALLTQGEEAGLLLEARPDPARACLILTLAPTAEMVPETVLLERAERWRLRALEAGYEQLELRDGSGRLRGRQALVGSGMILLAPAPVS